MNIILITATLVGAAAGGFIARYNSPKYKPSGRLDEISDAAGNP